MTTIVTRDVESSLDLVTSFFIARLSDAEKRQVAALISDCADEASALGLSVQEKLFRFAEILWGGAAIGTEEMVEACATKTLALVTGYQEQKKVNGHRASMSPEWQRLVNSKRPSTVAEAPAVPAPVVEAPSPVMAEAEAPVVPVVAAEVPVVVVEPPAAPAVAAEVPAVRRRERKPAAARPRKTKNA
ncbi:MAG TPA: hypothetical protein PK156_33080 [Polyangium sp.]|nr:hypothetical protein [Polyangium sp.]